LASKIGSALVLSSPFRLESRSHFRRLGLRLIAGAGMILECSKYGFSLQASSVDGQIEYSMKIDRVRY